MTRLRRAMKSSRAHCASPASSPRPSGERTTLRRRCNGRYGASPRAVLDRAHRLLVPRFLQRLNAPAQLPIVTCFLVSFVQVLVVKQAQLGLQSLQIARSPRVAKLCGRTGFRQPAVENIRHAREVMPSEVRPWDFGTLRRSPLSAASAMRALGYPSSVHFTRMVPNGAFFVRSAGGSWEKNASSTCNGLKPLGTPSDR